MLNVQSYRLGEERQEDKNRKMKEDLISKKLGELLLLGYRMLNETCDECQCILMQKKNEPKYCVGCEDPEIKRLENRIEQPTISNSSQDLIKPSQHQNGIMDHSPSEPIVVQTNKATSKTNGVVCNNTATLTASNEFSDTIHVLKSKINWAKTELGCSTSVTYCKELCELIKSAVDTIEAIEKLNKIGL